MDSAPQSPAPAVQQPQENKKVNIIIKQNK